MELKKTQKIVCIIQARMGSSRLPGKVLKQICGQPMLGWVMKRASRSRLISNIVVATTIDPADDLIETFCKSERISCYRGSEFDVLDRYYQAAKAQDADILVRLTADCPLIDAVLVDATIEKLLEVKADFAANRLPPPYQRTYPIGLDTEVATIKALETAWRLAEKPFEREHVMPFLYDPQNNFKVLVLDADKNYGNQRWTVDTPEDLEFIQQVTKKLDCRMDFGWEEVLKILNENPELSKINANIAHKSLNDVDHRANLK
jgi:spore coat polysaccharide biosynthesis protein SpsF